MLLVRRSASRTLCPLHESSSNGWQMKARRLIATWPRGNHPVGSGRSADGRSRSWIDAWPMWLAIFGYCKYISQYYEQML